MILNMISGNGGTPVSGTPVVARKTTNAVTATKDSDSVISFSGLDVDSGETLVGVGIYKTGTDSTVIAIINYAIVLQNGSGWTQFIPVTVDGATSITTSNNVSFVKNGETGGTVTIYGGYRFGTDAYKVYPIVASLS